MCSGPQRRQQHAHALRHELLWIHSACSCESQAVSTYLAAITVDADTARHTTAGARGSWDAFLVVFGTTCIQGILLNIIVFIVMAVAYAVQRMFRRWPEGLDNPVRGFEVVPIAAAAEH